MNDDGIDSRRTTLLLSSLPGRHHQPKPRASTPLQRVIKVRVMWCGICWYVASADDLRDGIDSHTPQLFVLLARPSPSAKATGESSIAAGFGAQATGFRSVASGNEAKAVGEYSIAEGYQAQATGSRSVVSGVQSQATGEVNIALGRSVNAAGESSIAT